MVCQKMIAYGVGLMSLLTVAGLSLCPASSADPNGSPSGFYGQQQIGQQPTQQPSAVGNQIPPGGSVRISVGSPTYPRFYPNQNQQIRQPQSDGYGSQEYGTNFRSGYSGAGVNYGNGYYSGNGYYDGTSYQGLPYANYSYIQPAPLGGYEFGSYCTTPYGVETVPSAYSLYTGFPGYIYVDEGAVVDILPNDPVYTGDYIPYSAPSYQVNEYNYSVTNNYYSTSAPSTGGSTQSAPQSESVPQPASAPQPDYSAALSDIQMAWQSGSADLFRKHLSAAGTPIAVSIDNKYSYSIDSNHFAQITQDAFNALTTYSFTITAVRKQTDGSVTAFATHIYAPSSATDGTRHTMYLSFTLSNSSGVWLITAIDSSTSPLVATGVPQQTPVAPQVQNSPSVEPVSAPN